MRVQHPQEHSQRLAWPDGQQFGYVHRRPAPQANDEFRLGLAGEIKRAAFVQETVGYQTNARFEDLPNQANTIANAHSPAASRKVMEKAVLIACTELSATA